MQLEESFSKVTESRAGEESRRLWGLEGCCSGHVSVEQLTETFNPAGSPGSPSQILPSLPVPSTWDPFSWVLSVSLRIPLQ